MVVILTEDDVRSLLTMDEAVNAVESALIQQSTGRAINPPRLTIGLGIGVSRYNPGQKAFMRVMPAALTELGYAGVKMYVDVSAKWTEHTILYLFDTSEGRFLAVISADLLSDMRTGAAGGVAIKHLSRRNSSVVGLFGTGRQARTQLMAACSVRRITEVRVKGRDQEKARSFASEMSKVVGTNVRVCQSAQEVVKDADIIITATTSPEPLFNGRLVSEGAHVNAIGASFPTAREIDDYLVKVSKLVVNLREQALKENGEILIPISKGVITKDHIYAELCDLVSGKVEGRTTNNEITLFKMNGLAIWDVAVGGLVHEKAKKLGIGTNCQL